MKAIREFRYWLRWQRTKRLYPRRPLFYDTRNYLRWVRARFEARAWLRHNNPEAIAARCMFGLNRHARMGSGHGVVYPLKNELLRVFYQRGLCLAATYQAQKLDCWRCGGDGLDPEDDGDCWKCGGTGVYKRILLLRFVFEIAGRRYVWHQPKTLVDWPVEIVPGSDYGEYRGDAGERLDAPLTWLYTAAVVEYLKLCGAPVKAQLPTLRGCLWQDWRATDLSKVLYRWKRRWQDLREDVSRLLEFARTGHLPPSDREIPF